MDAAFEFLLPFESELYPLKFEVPVFEWGGLKYSQGDPKCLFGSNFELTIQTTVNNKSIKYLPEDYKKFRWKTITVSGDGLDIFSAHLFEYGSEEENFTLKDLVDALISNETRWAVIFEPQYDSSIKVKRGNTKNIIESLEYSLRFSGDGFLIYC